MKMDFIKSYCGLFLVRINGTYACIDGYTSQIKKMGTRKECNDFFEDYVNEISNRD